MISWIKDLWSAVKPSSLYMYGAIILAVTGGFASVVLYVASGARNKALLEVQKGTLRDYEVAARTKADLDRLSAAAARQRLRERWSRQ